MGWTTLSVRERTAERFRELKADRDEEVDGGLELTTDGFVNEILDIVEDGEESRGTSEYEDILNRIDDLESNLPRKVAEELQR